MFNYNLNIRKIQQGSTYESSWGEITDEMHKIQYFFVKRFIITTKLKLLKKRAEKESENVM